MNAPLPSTLPFREGRPPFHPMQLENQGPRRRRRDVALASALGLGLLLLPACSRSSSGGGRRGPAGIPVSAAEAKLGSLDVYLDAIGTVVPVYTVTVTSRVAGELTEVDYKEGQTVKKGDLLAVVDPRPYQAAVTQARGQLARDRALLQNAQIDLARYEEAYRQRAIPEQQLATAEATVAENQGIVQLDEGSLDAAQVNLDYTRIVSPIDGRVGLRLVDPGNIVQANGTAPIATVAQIDPITVIFTIAEDNLGEVVKEIRAGRPVPVLALDRSLSTTLDRGTLLAIDNEIDPTTGTVKARATFPNEHGELFPNQFVNARLLLKTLEQAVIVPAAAVQLNEAQSFVYVVQKDGTVQLKVVKVRATEGESAAITGVEPGDVLVTDGFDRLQNGAKVYVRKPAAPSAGAR